MIEHFNSFYQDVMSGHHRTMVTVISGCVDNGIEEYKGLYEQQYKCLEELKKLGYNSLREDKKYRIMLEVGRAIKQRNLFKSESDYTDTW